MKKVLFILFWMAFAAANAETIPVFPSFPMVIWGELKIDGSPAIPGTSLDFYDTSGKLLNHYTTVKSGMYGGTDPNLDLSPTLGQYSGNLTIKVTSVKGTFVLTRKDFTNLNLSDGCFAAPDIKFTSRSCRYDIAISTPSAIIPARFKDIDDSFASEAIIEFEKKGLVRGFSDNTFRPNNPITRAEFLALTINTSKFSIDKTSTTTVFTDIPGEGSWMIPYVEAGRRFSINGQIISGKRVFRPNDPITRAEAIAILFKLNGIVPVSSSKTSFSDVHASWQKPYIEMASELSVISGQRASGKKIFRPDNPLTRAEAVGIITKIQSLNR